ncbi:MAG TPA: UpxY family transcription antiterminator [Flavisolibacter sp.]|jgi:transcription antitermination factor NusG|nr:UpxY family transcription antiterminator [Flavisolibacter sp.]
MNEKWYAVYTRPRWEKKVSAMLSESNIENYCPLNRVTKQWSDRKKVIYEPLFTSYVFVRPDEKQFNYLKETTGIINYVYWLGKPAVIRDSEIDIIRQFLNEHDNVCIEKPHVCIHDTIKVTSGPLMDREGEIVVVKSNRVKVVLVSLGCIMYAEIDKANIELVSVRNFQERGRLQEKRSSFQY